MHAARHHETIGGVEFAELLSHSVQDGAPPSYVCWLINHRSIDISTISHSEMEVMFINFAFTNWGTTCDVIVHKKLALVAGDESRPS